ncbi:MAG: NIPSNAP family protein [Planctomycetes bacterium]|nr:NIPSNAP family protein [Planctomycetota bacterium]
MNRREFLVTGVAGATAANLTGAQTAGQASPEQFFEWRQYHLRTGANRNQVGDFLKNVGIAALNRIGVRPVGVFNPVYGPSKPTLHVLLVHPSLDSVLSAWTQLQADPEVQEKGAPFLNASLAEPAYVRYESSLLKAFSQMPKLAVPIQRERILELRIYESHSAKAGKKKIEMFNEGGEIAIFKKTGLNPVLFGETIVGPNMPNLHYMLVFKDLADRDRRWQTFRDDPDWKKLSADPAYKDTVSNITDIILKPTDYSQI